MGISSSIDLNEIHETFLGIFSLSGVPSQIDLTCAAFEQETKQEEDGEEKVVEPSQKTLKLFCKASIPSHIICNLMDKAGNHCHVKTPLSLEWVPLNGGTSVKKKTNGKGEAIFQANSVKCLAEKDFAKIKIIAPEIKSVKVRLFCFECSFIHLFLKIVYTKKPLY